MTHLSVILPTDTYATIRPVVEHWLKQSARTEVELVLVAPSAEAVSQALEHRREFANLQIVENPLKTLGLARAAGIRAANSPVIFVGETHSYPQPGFAETLLAHFSGPWTSVAPAFGNANPKGVLSWAAFLSDYGRWVDGLPEGEIPETPIYNAAYRLAALLEFGERLAPALDHGDELWITLRARRHRAFQASQPRLDHVNVARPRDWVRERFFAGVLTAHHRSQRWDLTRRLAYLGGSPLIPFVLTWRVAPGAWRTIRRKRLPWLTFPAIFVGMVIKSLGEFFGYAGYLGRAECHMHEYEVHKLAYAGAARQ